MKVLPQASQPPLVGKDIQSMHKRKVSSKVVKRRHKIQTTNCIPWEAGNKVTNTEQYRFTQEMHVLQHAALIPDSDPS